MTRTDEDLARLMAWWERRAKEHPDEAERAQSKLEAKRIRAFLRRVVS